MSGPVRVANAAPGSSKCSGFLKTKLIRPYIQTREDFTLLTHPESTSDPWLERQDDIHRLLTPALLLNVGECAAAAVGEARLGDLRQIDGVVTLMSSAAPRRQRQARAFRS